MPFSVIKKMSENEKVTGSFKAISYKWPKCRRDKKNSCIGDLSSVSSLASIVAVICAPSCGDYYTVTVRNDDMSQVVSWKAFTQN